MRCVSTAGICIYRAKMSFYVHMVYPTPLILPKHIICTYPTSLILLKGFTVCHVHVKTIFAYTF